VVGTSGAEVESSTGGILPDALQPAVNRGRLSLRLPIVEYARVTPRIVTPDVEGLVGFFRAVFDAEAETVPGRPVDVRIGDSIVLVSGVGERAPFPAFLYVYVENADVTYARAVAAGAATLEAPLDTPYGDRRAMVQDRWGDVFQIAHRLTPSA
jgi:uncharacterized glyoxalase superfamily protein PhnB